MRSDKFSPHPQKALFSATLIELISAVLPSLLYPCCFETHSWLSRYSLCSLSHNIRFCATELIRFSLYFDLDISWNWGFHWSNVYFRGYPLTSRSSQIFISLPHEFLFLIFLFPASHFVVGDVRCARNLYCHWSLSSSGHLSRPLIKFSTPFHVHFLSNVKYFPNGPPAVNQTPVVDALRFPSLMSRVKKKKKQYLKQYVMKE